MVRIALFAISYAIRRHRSPKAHWQKKKLLPCDFDEITLGMVEDACTYISFDGDEVTVEDQISPSVKFRVRVGVRVKEDEGEIHQSEDEDERER